MVSSTEGTDSVQKHYDWSDISPSYAIIETISDIEGVAVLDLPEELDGTLADHIDPDALNRLVATDTDTRVAFRFEKYWVEIDGETLCVSYD